MKLQRVSSLVVAGILLAAAVAVPAAAEPAGAPAKDPAASIGAAAAEDAPSGRRSSDRSPGAGQAVAGAGPRFALGVSSPTGWLRAPLGMGHSSFGASLSVGLDRHHAIRANVARYDAFEGLPLLLAISGLQDTLATGRILDASLGWVYYPRRLWDGFVLEAGVLRRERDVEEEELDGLIDFDSDSTTVTTESVTHAGRVSIGWSWRVTRHLFISAAAGVSVGRETGHRTTKVTDDGFEMVGMRAVDRVQVDPELYLRFGFTFGR